jgi:hypothetical protein
LSENKYCPQGLPPSPPDLERRALARDDKNDPRFRALLTLEEDNMFSIKLNGVFNVEMESIL